MLHHRLPGPSVAAGRLPGRGVSLELNLFPQVLWGMFVFPCLLHPICPESESNP